MAGAGGNRFDLPELGLGLGLRSAFLAELIESDRPAGLDFVEISSENYTSADVASLELLDELAARYPVVMHGTALSIGSSDPLDLDHLDRLTRLADRLNARWISDHVAWTSIDGIHLHELLPLPRTQESLEHVVDRIRRAQDRLGRPLVLENAASYLEFRDNEMSEGEFLAAMAEEADCALLLDLGNLVVSSRNHGFDALADFLDHLPLDRVVELHVAGHEDRGSYLIDSHDREVAAEVRELHRRVIGRGGPGTTLLERDGELPPLAQLIDELRGFGAER